VRPEEKIQIAKSSKKTAVGKKTNGKPNPLHEKLIKLFSRPNGATITDISEAGFKYAAMAALKIAERRGLKTSVKKPGPGELMRYYAKRA
jgi:hypothetical protein